MCKQVVVFFIVRGFTYYTGLPVPQKVRASDTSNTTVTLRWHYPPPPFETITNFMVSKQVILASQNALTLSHMYAGNLFRQCGVEE